MKVSPAGRDLIASFEGLSLAAYLCPAGVWTIGYGHTRGVARGDRLAGKAAAAALLDEDLAEFAASVEPLIGGASPSVGQAEFDALVSLAFNIGLGGFAGSTVLRLHRKGCKAGAARAFGLWNKATVAGRLVEMPGLTRRRAAEAALYLAAPEAGSPPPMPQTVAAPASASTSKTVLAGGAAALSVAGGVADQIGPALASISAAGTSAATLARQLGPVVLGVLALALIAFVVVRYVLKLRRGEAVST